MPTCKEVSRSVSSGDIESANWIQRLACWLHFAMCADCRRYRDQVDELGKLARQGAAAPDRDSMADIEAEILANLD
jgi:hypothetical protein